MNEGMKAGDFKPCAMCGKGMAHAGSPIFYRVRLETMGLNPRAIQRADAMERYMGGAVALARVFEDPEIATQIDSMERLVCMACLTDGKPLALLLEAEQHSSKGGENDK